MGRSSVTGSGQSHYDRPETIEETAELVTRLGGTGIAIQVDHPDRTAGRGIEQNFQPTHPRSIRNQPPNV